MDYNLELLKLSISNGYKITNNWDVYEDNWSIAYDADRTLWQNSTSAVTVVKNLINDIPMYLSYQYNPDYIDLPELSEEKANELAEILLNRITEIVVNTDRQIDKISLYELAYRDGYCDDTVEINNIWDLYRWFEINFEESEPENYNVLFKRVLSRITNNQNLLIMLESDDDEIISLATNLIINQYVEDDGDINDGDPVLLTEQYTEKEKEKEKIIAELYS